MYTFELIVCLVSNIWIAMAVSESGSLAVPTLRELCGLFAPALH